MPSEIYIARVIVDPSTADKINRKHDLTEQEVREAFLWPARPEVRYDDDPEHGPRWLALGENAAGQAVFGALVPAPWWEQERAESWVLLTARRL